MGDQKASLARKCITTIRQEGLRGFCAKAAARVGEYMFATNSADWYRAELSQEPPSVPVPPEVSVDFNAWDEVHDWLLELRDVFRWVYVIEELRVARDFSHVYPLLRAGRSKAGYIKVGFQRAYVTDFEAEISIPPGCAFVYDTFVLPEYRSRGLATFMISEVLAFLRRRDMRYVWCHIPSWNAASIRAFTKNGFVRTKHVRYFRVGWRGFRTCDPQRLMRREEASFFRAWRSRFRSEERGLSFRGSRINPQARRK